MDCFTCRRTAVGSCRFCGRGVCENHLASRPYILELLKLAGVTQALVVEDALYCGVCHPRPTPVAMPELDG
ncbi:MAG TPA: DUF2180 family protein [Actinomycetes bacterium]|nr:DUF2180 family protein [Actinomycetes bacterium]